MTLQQKLLPELETYLNSVRIVLHKNGMDQTEAAELLDNLHHHAWATAEKLSETMSEEEAVRQTIASLDAPETYRTANEALREPAGQGDHKNTLGAFSILISAGTLIAGITLSDKDIFDTPLSGSTFMFGQIIALAFGLPSLSTIWGKIGSLCAGAMLGFIVLAFLWMQIVG